jgi:TP901 family phage tail tape measure protein
MNVGTLTISLTARTAALMSSLSKVRTFESGVMASVQRMNRSLGTLGQSLSVLSLPLIGIGGLAIKKFADFEYSLAKVTGLADVASSQVQKWTADIFNLSKKTGESAHELAEALYFVASSGIHGAKVLETLEVAAYGAMAGLGKTKDLANLLTSVMNAYGVSNVNASETLDILVAAVREGKAEANEMAKSLGMVVNVASELGISFANVAAAVAATTKTGVGTNTAATQLRQFLFSFLKERPMVENALESMGLTFAGVRESLSKDLLGGLIRLRAVTSAWGDEMLAKVIPNVRAFNEALSLTGVNVVETMKVFEVVKNPTNNFAQAVGAVADTARVKLNRAMQTVNNSLITFGASIADDVIPIVEKFTGFISKLVGWFNSLDSGTQNMIITVTALSTVLGPALIVVSGFVSSLGSIVATLTSPLGIILAIAAAITLVVRNFDNWEKAWPRIVQQMRKGGVWILKIMNTISNSITFGVFDERLEKERRVIQHTIDEINASLNGFEPKEFLNRYYRTVRALGGIHPKQRNSLTSLIKQTTAASLVLKEYNPEITKADPDLAYGFSNALGDSLESEFNKLLSLVDNFTKDLGGKLAGTSKLKLNISGGEGGITSASFLEYTASLFDKVTNVKRIKEFLALQSELTKAFGPTGFMSGAGLVSATAGIGDYFQQIKKEMSSIIESSGDLKGFWDSLPQGIKAMFPIEDVTKINELIKLNADAVRDADAALASWAENAWIWKSMGNPMMDYFEKLHTALAELTAIRDLSGGGPEALDARLKYWETIKQAAIDAAIEIKKDNLFAKIPQDVLDSYKNATLMITGLQVVQTLVGAVTDAFAALGDGIGKSMANAEDAFSGLLNVIVGVFQQIGKLLITASTFLMFVPGLQGLALGLLAGGIGLNALGGYITEKQRQKQSSANMASGGIVPSGFPNDTFSANLSSNEAVIPLERLPQLLGIGRSSKNNTVEFIIEGRVLKGILKDADMMGGLR